MATKTEIANYALAQIGDMRIESIDDGSTKAARFCSLLYPQARDEVLSSHRWSSAKKQAALSAHATTPIYKWAYSFALPSDFLRLTEVEGQDAFTPQKWYDIQGGNLLLDTIQGETTTVAIEYIARIEDPMMFDSLLVEAIALKLASKIAKPITGSDGKAGELLQEYERIVVPKAMTADAQQRSSNENSPVVKMMAQSRLLRARR